MELTVNPYSRESATSHNFLAEFPVTELVLKGKTLRAKIDTSALPVVLSVSTRWTAYWHKGSRTHYALSTVHGERVYLHRLVTSAPPDKEVDHRNHDGLDNRLSELRVTNRAENVRNTRGYVNKHGHRGVRWYSPLSKWNARARLNGKFKHLGYFATKEEAGAAYQKFFDERLRGGQ